MALSPAPTARPEPPLPYLYLGSTHGLYTSAPHLGSTPGLCTWAPLCPCRLKSRPSPSHTLTVQVQLAGGVCGRASLMPVRTLHVQTASDTVAPLVFGWQSRTHLGCASHTAKAQTGGRVESRHWLVCIVTASSITSSQRRASHGAILGSVPEFSC